MGSGDNWAQPSRSINSTIQSHILQMKIGSDGGGDSSKFDLLIHYPEGSRNPKKVLADLKISALSI